MHIVFFGDTLNETLSLWGQAEGSTMSFFVVKMRYIEDIQMFGVNMTFISSSEVKKCIFHECRRHE